jgi:hypothetical protein
MIKTWKAIFTLFVVVGAIALPELGAAASSSAKTCNTAADRAAILQAVNTMFDAAAKNDLTLFHSVTTPDFYAFDNGKQFQGDELMEQVQKLHQAGHVFVWKVTEPRIQAGCHIAWITEINRGSVDGNPTRWLESGTLNKIDGNWRVVFFNSARAAETPVSPAAAK